MFCTALFLGSTSRLDGSSSSRDRSLWSLQQRSIPAGGGSAWARSTTTRDSPVLSGLADGLSSLFSVVEHSGSTESLWKGDTGNISALCDVVTSKWRNISLGQKKVDRPVKKDDVPTASSNTIFDYLFGSGASQTASPARQPPAAGKPSGVTVCGSDPSSQRYGGLVQEFFKNVCSSRGPGGVAVAAERALGYNSMDEAKLECVAVGAGGHGALAGFGVGNDHVTRIVNKRFMRQTAGEEMVSIMGGGKDMANISSASGMEVRPTE